MPERSAERGAASGRASRCWSISPFAKRNYVDGTFTDQSSVVQFIEDNWLGGQRIGGGAADATAGTLDNMFSFHGEQNRAAVPQSEHRPSRSAGW